jgi:formamidopyrimidine-DNA glycosylase
VSGGRGCGEPCRGPPPPPCRRPPGQTFPGIHRKDGDLGASLTAACTQTLGMVEGHSVHRLAVSHTKRLVGRAFKATSPNKRFTDGARAIDGRTLCRMEAVGKNLFAFFAMAGKPEVVVNVHFGMSGRWSVVDAARAQPARDTTRLQLEGQGIVSHLSAMTVVHGCSELYESKKLSLGEDPLRDDADPERLWARVSKSTKSIGALLMDQSYFAGVGNIFRCEILLVAGVHPNVRGSDLSRAQYEAVWAASVRLMRRAFTLGSIVTVEPHEAAAVNRPKLRRWLYNSRTCGRCGGPVLSWQIQGRTCYACVACQPLAPSGGAEAEAPADSAPPQLFHSHCVSDTFEERLATPQKLRVAEPRAALRAENLPTGGKKAELIERLEARGLPKKRKMRSAHAAAADKVAADEARSVEHIAEFEDLEESDAEEWIEVDGDSIKGGVSAKGSPSEVVVATTPAKKKPRRRATARDGRV